MQVRRPHIVYLGERGFPIGFAAIQRQVLVSKGLIENGCKVTVTSYKGIHGPDQDFPPIGTYEGIHYRYTSGSIHEPKGTLARNWLKVYGRIKELAFLRQLKEQGDLDACMIATRSIALLFLYWAWLKYLRTPSALWMVELNSAIDNNSSFLDRINDYLFERFNGQLADGIFPISEFLVSHVKKHAPGTAVMKSPIICDFSEFNLQVEKDGETRFLYCGNPSYYEVAHFILDAFDRLEIEGKPVYLDLILGGGSQKALQRVKEEIARCQNKGHIRIYRNIPREDIPVHYAKAAALLIPLRPTIQDKARFPHKLGEYLASGNPVITTAIGEINHYDFIDKQTALLADDYQPEAFAEKMQFVLDHPERAIEIGYRGKEMGFRNFNHIKLSKEIKDFLLSLKYRTAAVAVK